MQWLEAFQGKVHNRNQEAENWRISLGIGSQDLLSKVTKTFDYILASANREADILGCQAFQLLVDDGDAVLMESPAYSYAEGYSRLIASYKDLYRSANARFAPISRFLSLLSRSLYSISYVCYTFCNMGSPPLTRLQFVCLTQRHTGRHLA